MPGFDHASIVHPFAGPHGAADGMEQVLSLQTLSMSVSALDSGITDACWGTDSCNSGTCRDTSSCATGTCNGTSSCATDTCNNTGSCAYAT